MRPGAGRRRGHVRGVGLMVTYESAPGGRMPRIFISYRRTDTAAYAGRLHDRLCERFGASHVFLDVDALQPGEDFVRSLDERLSGCDVLLVLIGDEWLGTIDENGRRRLDDERDFVRQEIAAALARPIRVIPVLVGGGAMPAEDDLPAPLRALARRQAFEIRDAQFHEDASRLMAALAKPGFRARIGGKGVLSKMLLWVAPAVVIAGTALLLQQTQSSGDGGARSAAPPNRTEAGPAVRLRSEPATVTAEQAKVMLARYNFYCKGANEAGTGIVHRFATRVIGETVVVEDEATGLMWEKGGSGRPILGEAKGEYVRAVNDRAPGGFRDWRLPTLEEAMSLMSRQQEDKFHIDPIFERGPAPFTWTSDQRNEERGWVVYYLDGTYASERHQYNAPIRLVRTISPR